MFASLGGIVLGVLLGLRHAFEPDHLTAVSTLVADAPSGRRSVWLGALWGVGHTVSLAVVGTLLLATGTALPERVGAAFELAVAAMLVLLGIRSLVSAVRADDAPAHPHPHPHPHGGARHVHVAGRVITLRPLAVGLVHGLAGSGAITAIVFAELPSFATRITYIVLFGIGSIAGMAIASGIAGVSLHRIAGSARQRRVFAIATGLLSVGVGIAWAIPELALV